MKFPEAIRRLRWLTPLLFLIVVGLTGILLINKWNQIISFPWRFSWINFCLTLMFHSLALGITFVIWHLMINHLGGMDDWKKSFRYYYVSTLAKRIPTSFPYIGSRLAFYTQAGISAASVINCILLETILVGVGGILVFLFFLPYYSHTPPQITLPFAMIGTLSLIVFLVRPQLFVEASNNMLGRFGKKKMENLPSNRDILLWVGLYTLPWLFAGFSLYYGILTFSSNSGLSVVDAIGISTISMLVALTSVILPGGFGLKELTYGFLLSPWVPFSTAILFTFVYRIMQTSNEILWALLSIWVSPNTESTKVHH